MQLSPQTHDEGRSSGLKGSPAPHLALSTVGDPGECRNGQQDPSKGQFLVGDKNVGLVEAITELFPGNTGSRFAATMRLNA